MKLIMSFLLMMSFSVPAQAVDLTVSISPANRDKIIDDHFDNITNGADIKPTTNNAKARQIEKWIQQFLREKIRIANTREDEKTRKGQTINL